MAEIVVVTWDGGGNVPPALAIAAELAAGGHGIRLLGHRSQRSALEATGHEVVEPRHARTFSAADAYSARSMLAAFGDRGLGRDLLEQLERRPADVVVVDALMFGVLDVARGAGIRYLVLEHFYDAYYRRVLSGPVGLVMRATGRRPNRALEAASARIVTSLAALDPVRTAAHLHQVGPVVTWRPRVQGDDPMVLVSLSTFGFPRMKQTLQSVLDGCAGVPARVVVTTGPRVDPASLRVPSGVEVHRYVPHADLMPRASVVVGHGGHGTTMQALAHDLPVLVLPMDPKTDQPLVGRSLERAGAGRMLPRSSDPATIGDAVRALLADGPHRAAAARLGAQVRSSAGAAGAAAAVEAALTAQPRLWRT